MKSRNKTSALDADVKHLNEVSLRHYGVPLANVLAQIDTPLGQKQFSRLIGVIVKEPFADEKKRRRTKATHAVQTLEWKSRDEIKKIAPKTWQLEFIRELASLKDGKQLSDADAFEQLLYFQTETGLGKYIFEVFRERICGDPKSNAAVSAAIEEARKAGVTLTDPTVTNLSVGTASIVAVAVASVLPAALAVVASPVIGGISLLILQVGVKGFCKWSEEVIKRDAKPTSEEEI